MYFVDREKIEATIDYLEKLANIFENQQTWETEVEQKALERIAQMMIETVLDIGNGIIDGFIMRDPGSYEDIIDILTDESVVGKEEAEGLKRLISFRKILVQNYLDIRHPELEKTIKTYLPVLKHFVQRVRSYLEDELGSVNAFKH